MSTIKTFLQIAALGSSTFAWQALAETCSQNACWQAINESQESVVVDCAAKKPYGNYDEGGLIFTQRKLDVGETIYKQMPLWWGDGFGWPETDRALRCTISYSDHGAVNLAFSAPDWGGLYQVRVHTDKVQVVFTDMWGRNSGSITTWEAKR